MVWFTLPHQQGGGVVTDEQVRLLMSLLKQGIVAGDCGGEGRDERADGAQIRALWGDALGGEGAAHVADAVGSVCRGVAGDRGAVAAGRRPAGEDGVGGAEPSAMPGGSAPGSCARCSGGSWPGA